MLRKSDLIVGLRLALQARFLTICFWILVAQVLIVAMAAQFSGRQPATVALDIGVSFIRIALPLVIVILSQELISKEFERRYFLTSLTYPRPRHHFYLGRALVVFSLSVLLLAIMASVLAGMVALISADYAQATPVSLGNPYILTTAFIVVDLFVLTAVASLFAVVASTPSFILVGTIGFMLVSRSYGDIVALLNNQIGLVAHQEMYQDSLGVLGYLLPDLGALDIRMVSLYNTLEFLPSNWPAIIISTVAYALALTGLALWILQRKRFS
ncbi:hypothetical protein [Thiohalomonas denitrificans]|uniref:hypothetical protein n=1 Tax=Thiohalomonas denitrificans TaxID=415747 RepID=UPI0026E9CCC3|nr:hypothetical protein [Thiohalomonas denitrificans]